MENTEPSLGYSVLAKVLADTRHKVVVTTNFDNLVADALAIHALQHPLIVGHESLTGFVRPQLPRPLVAKIHRDLHLHPKNDQNGVDTLEKGWEDALKLLFQHYTPLVIGYGGNDGSLMGFLAGLSPGHIPGRLFWCYREGDRPGERILETVAKHNGVLVAIAGFDEFMVQLARTLFLGFELDGIAKEIENLGIERAKRYQAQADRLFEKLARPDTASRSSTTDKARQSISAASHDPSKWWSWVLRARAEDDYDKREAIYREALIKLPESAELTGNYASFLNRQRKDYDAAEAMYKKALELDPSNAANTGNYATFLVDQRKDYDAAEAMYEKALELDPSNAAHTGNYASFLVDQRKDYDAAEAMYKKALELDPSNAANTGNYATFLVDQRKDYDAAEAMYKKALELDPSHAANTGNYATFLVDQRKDYDTAEAMYKKALELDPSHANITANYASLLLNRGGGDAVEKAHELVVRAVALSYGQPSQALAEALFYDCLICELTSSAVSKSVGRLKALFLQDFERGSWDFSALLDAVLPKVALERRAFYRTLGDAILDANKIAVLDAFPLWVQAELNDPFTLD